MAKIVQELRRAVFLAGALTEAASPPEVTSCLSEDSSALLPLKPEFWVSSSVSTIALVYMFHAIRGETSVERDLKQDFKSDVKFTTLASSC